jgi:hypothetical protein
LKVTPTYSSNAMPTQTATQKIIVERSPRTAGARARAVNCAIIR